MRETLTDKKDRALCMAFRNGKRCKRLARFVVLYDARNTTPGRQARCSECSKRADTIRIESESSLGFRVISTYYVGYHSRKYEAIK